jgi:peroxiredoxin
LIDEEGKLREGGLQNPRRAQRWLAVASLLFAIVVFVAYRLAPAQLEPAPDIAVTTLQGETLALSSLEGKVVLVNFWATTCVVCVREMPRLTELYQRYKAQGYEMLAVAMPYDPPHRVIDYTRRNALPFTVALDLEGKAAWAFGDVRATPTTFLIDRNGMIVREYVGEPNFARLDSLIAKTLGER